MKQRVAVALSGGADSAIAASLLAAQGYDVIGIHLLMTRSQQAATQAERARRVATHLGIGFETMDVADSFEAGVITPFCEEYAEGRTPNPCVRCNREIKFGILLQEVLARGAELLATGHYARVATEGDRFLLQKAVDRRADQSYFLYAIPQSCLPRLAMPLGTVSRGEVRLRAAQIGLNPSESSQDICFVGERGYRSFVEKRILASPGDIVDAKGVVRGHHIGLPYYTVGQRHGLGIALGEPAYVVRLDVGMNRVMVGDADLLLARAAMVRELNWLSATPATVEFDVQARIRYRAPCTNAGVSLRTDGALVRFEDPQRAVTPGQSLVFYDGDTVLGGGIIVESLKDKADAETDSSAELG